MIVKILRLFGADIEEEHNRFITFPLHVDFADEEVEYILNMLKDF